MSERIYEEAWHYAMQEIKKEFENLNKSTEFSLYFEKMIYVEDTIDTITISLGTVFLKTMIETKGYLDKILNKIKEITCQDNLKIECLIKEEKKSTENLEIPTEEKPKENYEKDFVPEVTADFSIKQDSLPKTNKKHPQLKEEYNFDSFVSSDNTMFAYNAALAISKNPGKQHNPVLFYGGVGLGKTHLMQAVGNYIHQNNSDLKVCYVTAETFTNEFTSSFVSGTTNAFKNKYRNLDVLLIDDIHFLQGKEGTQEELFYAFNSLHDKKAQMVFTCDRPIREIRNMTERLLSRLSNGLCIDLQPPTYETRCAIIQKKLELQNKQLSSEIIDFIAKNVQTNIRDLESALNKLLGYAELTNKEITMESAKNLLKDIFSGSNSENISLETIQKVIAKNYNITVAELKGKKRDKKFVIPRQIAIYITRELTEYSFTEIGNEFGGKDHSTIMHACEKINEQIRTDSSFDLKIQAFIREIREYKK